MNPAWHDDVLMVIPSLAGAALLARMLPTLRFTPGNVAVLDQGGDDGTEALCAAAGVQVVQLGRAHTYTEACNIGARLARDRGCQFLCVANNDIAFRTDVVAELHGEMLRDPALGIVAPSQVVVDAALGAPLFTSRVCWDLDQVVFVHDTAAVAPTMLRLDADFCELTCALVRMAAIEEVGFLDDAYGFYHEDADFGFRLRQAGWSSAYLPQAQIEHYASSTFTGALAERKRAYIEKNRAYFARKHLGLGVRPSLPTAPIGGAWDAFGFELAPALRRHGLVELASPELVMARPGVDTGYCYTDYAAPELPARWLRHAGRCRAVFTAAAGMRAVFEQAGFAPAFHVPPGVETDVFRPWAPGPRPFDAPTVLALAEGWQRDWLATLFEAWRGVVDGGRDAWLVVAGHGLAEAFGTAPDWRRNNGLTDISRFGAERIELHDRLGPDADPAAPFRGIDAVVPNPGDPGLRMALLRAQACGIPVIAAEDAALDDVVAEGPRYDGSAVGLQDAIEALLGLGDGDRAALSDAALYRVRARNTLRHSAAGLYAALGQLQVRDPAAALDRIARVTAVAVPPEPAEALAPRRSVARRIKVAGRLTSLFGAEWEEQGLRAAGRAVGGELRFFLDRGKPAEKVRPAAAPSVGSGAEAPVAGSVLLVGYIDAHLGLGQSMRGMASAMAAVDCPFAIYPVGIGVEGRRGPPVMVERHDLVRGHAVNVLEVATNELPNVRAHVGEYHFDRSYNILRTYWELAQVPAEWRPNLAGIHEVWAPTRFVAEAFRTVFDGPITVVPPCIDLPQPAADGRAQFGLDPARFLFLFSFDYYSFPQRKNPLGVVRAFTRAFPASRQDVGLVLKSTGAAGHFPGLKQVLREAAARDGRITIIDESFTRDEMLALILASDAYVSLHRSEGFGLGMAEAMVLGKPVIGTDYAGSTDFLSAETGYPVACTLRALAPDEYVHPEGQVWAEPDEAAAAAALRAVADDRTASAARALAGQRHIRGRFGPDAVGALVKARLDAIATSGGR